MRLDKYWLEILSDLSVELAGGWYAAAIIVPDYTNLGSLPNSITLLANLVFGTILLVIARKLKRYHESYRN